MICSVDKCNKPIQARGYCNSHYANWRRNGGPEPIHPRVDRPKKCSVDGCDEQHSAKGYCSKHYARFATYGSTDLPEPLPKFKCKVDGCDRTDGKAIGFCNFHYYRHSNGIPLDHPLRMKHKGGTVCAFDGCNKPRGGTQWCGMHYQRQRIHGDVNWKPVGREKGEGKKWHLAPHGYVVRYEPDNPNAGSNGQVYQHRHIMSETIGRPLLPNENVHHVNGDRSDNSPENLELWDKGQPAGQRVTDRVKWCIDYLSGDAVDAALKLEPEISMNLSVLLQKLA